jgi:DMSO/TMAO reductase YedYZ heme-binding membrane subunit
MNPQTWWYLARASGLVAWGLLSASVVWGLLLSTRLTKGRPTPAWILDLHRFLGGSAVIFTALHLAGLVADSYVHFGIADLLVPYASSWQPAAVALGIVALYLLAAVEITSLLMRRLPRKLWHGIHLTSYAVFWLATFHLLLAGTDAANPIIRWTVAMVMAGVVFLSLVRVVSGRGGAKPTRHASTPTRPPTSQPVGAVHLASREEPPVPEDV